MTTTTLTPTASSLYAFTATRAERVVQRIALVVVVLAVILGAYAYLAASGHAPVAPWSPIGQVQQQEERDLQRQQDELREIVPQPVAPDSGVSV